MTPIQTELARRALGLPAASGTSSGNRFVCGAGSAVHEAWLDLVDSGLAEREYNSPVPSERDLFRLTRRGAERALLAGERLCHGDFPDRDAAHLPALRAA